MRLLIYFLFVSNFESFGMIGEVPATIVNAIFVKVFIAILIGYLFARLTSGILAGVFDDMLVEVSLPLIICYLSYYVSETFKSSGVLTCVCFGIFLDRQSICPDNHDFLHKFFQMLAYLANVMVFLIVGILCYELF